MFPRNRLATLVPPDRLDHLEAGHAQLADEQQRAQERAWAAVDNDTLRDQLNAEPPAAVAAGDAPSDHERRVAQVRGLLEPATSKRTRKAA